MKELEDKIKLLTQHLEPQSMSALFEQVEEEVKQKQRIEELEAQIEKMKCCANCAFDSLEPPEVISNGVCENCINHSKWGLED